LDSSTAVELIKVLRELANSGTTIVCTIHQPSSDIYKLFDQLALLTDGKLAYLGGAHEAMKYFANQGFPCPKHYNPADHFINVLSDEKPAKKLVEVWDKNVAKNSEKYKGIEDSPKQSKTKRGELYNSSWGYQFLQLLKRSFLNLLRDPINMRGRLGRSIFISLFLGLVLFFLSLFYLILFFPRPSCVLAMTKINPLFKIASVQSFSSCSLLPSLKQLVPQLLSP